MSRGGKRPVWNEFTIDKDGNYPDAMCIHCRTKLYKCQPSRNLIKHLASCPGLSDGAQLQWRRYGESVKKHKRKRQKRKKSSYAESPGAKQDSVMTEASQSPSQQLQLTNVLAGEITNKVKNRFQEEIARGFYAAGLPFRSIEVPHMRKALTVLQPAMEKYLPNRKSLAGRLLTKEYERENECLRNEPTLALLSDGWTSTSKEKVVNYIVVSPLMRPLLWCTKTTGEDKQKAEYVAQAIGSVIAEINAAIGRSAVISVTTDNAPVMLAAWEILERVRPVSAIDAAAIPRT